MDRLNGGGITSQPAAAEPAARPASAHVGQWLDGLNIALHSTNQASVASLFAQDGHWRDLFAFTWNITPCQVEITS